MSGLINKIFIWLLTGLVNGSNHTKWVSLSSQKYMTHLLIIIHILVNIIKNFTTIHLWLNQIVVLEELYYYPFVVKSDSCVGSCFTVINLLIKYTSQIKQKI